MAHVGYTELTERAYVAFVRPTGSELASNFISDLSAFNFPRRLNYLDLSSNSISALPSSTPWPESGELQTLLLQGNALASVAADTFVDLVALQALSLSSTGITNLDELELPPSLRTLNATNNSFASASTNFSNLPVALQYLSLADNPLATIEICRSDVSVFQSLTELTAPSSLLSSCSSSSATLEEIQGVYFCVLEDADCLTSSTSDSASSSEDGPSHADIGNISSDGDSSSSTAVAADSGSSSIFSAEAIGIIGSTFFLVGILLSALVFGLVRRRQKTNGREQRAAKKARRDRRAASSGSNFLAFASSGGGNGGGAIEGSRTDEFDGKDDEEGDFRNGVHTPADGWGFESPVDQYNPVAILEESPKGGKASHLGASTASLQVRSKLKSKMDLDDLLVFEIPPEEIQMRRALHTSLPAAKKSSSKVEMALSSVAGSRKAERALFLAEYQGYKVVIHALMRSKKRTEARFVAQIRLAASLDHASIVHFIGVTTGCSSTASRRRGSSAAAPYAGYGQPNHSHSNSKSRYTNMGAPSWHLGVVFEFMHHGSLAALFEAERHRREGKGFFPNGSVASSIGSGGGNIFSWYPVFAGQASSSSVNANPNADWRCKLSIALDVAMGLVYLHANNYAHGRVCARKVLVNEHGEAKLSALDVLLPADLTGQDDRHRKTEDMRGSLRDSALWMGQKLSSFRPSGASASSGLLGKSFSRSMRSSRATTSRPPTAFLGRSRFHNNSGESEVSAVSGVTLDDNSHSGGNPALEEDDAFDETSLNSSGLQGVTLAAQQADIYSFGTFLWELDTMIAVEEDLAASGRSSGAGGDPHLLQFSADCPRELQTLARRCWREEPSERPDAVDVQEELVRALEGRLTTSTQVPSNWTRPTTTSALGSLSSSELSDMSSLPSSCSVLAVSVADL
ncbi:hypothetical protein BBJ28_00000982 [Nothophytophthora sp. Chile5]|nr:hypothetical protein BBJ28_00000982 [Nothophytophthora sp. Chile5]